MNGEGSKKQERNREPWIVRELPAANGQSLRKENVCEAYWIVVQECLPRVASSFIECGRLKTMGGEMNDDAFLRSGVLFGRIQKRGSKSVAAL
jgi:hypothetical protein